MTLRQYLLLMGVGTALAWGAVGIIIATVDPTDTQLVVFGVFYASLWLALTGTLSIIGFVLRVALLKKQLVVSRHVAVSFRQAVLLALLIVVSLFLQSRSLLTWWNAVLIVAALTVLEFFFISAKTRPERG
ncbi:MAG TPA: hypothetical protein VL500_03535 [Candidatus Eisenbacteria bacterium]|jgi:hypothetical protein|nr:hypothetical protein [Candidatus Eisenbacteria bacterium]